MAEKNGATATEAGNGKKKSKESRKRVMTFIYQDAPGSEIKLGKHKTNAFSVDAAWKEFVTKQDLKTAVRTGTALHGFAEWMENKLRVPTREELEKIVIANNLL